MAKAVAVIQARMGSSRFPGKVMKKVSGMPVLAHVVRRVQRVGSVDEELVATTTSPKDDIIAEWCSDNHVRFFRGSENNVLERFVLACRQASADVVIRITADCPAIDPSIIERALSVYYSSKVEYVSNTLERSFPHGMDVEVVKFAALEAAWQEATEPFEFEHVTPFVWRQPQRFDCTNFCAKPSETMPDLRITLDTPRDYLLIRAVFDLLGPDFGCEALVDLVKARSWIKELNDDVKQKPVFADSVKEIRQARELVYAAKYCEEQDLSVAAGVLLEKAERLVQIYSGDSFIHNAESVPTLIAYFENWLYSCGRTGN